MPALSTLNVNFASTDASKAVSTLIGIFRGLLPAGVSPHAFSRILVVVFPQNVVKVRRLRDHYRWLIEALFCGDCQKNYEQIKNSMVDHLYNNEG